MNYAALKNKRLISQEEFLVHETTTVDYYGTRPLEGQVPYLPRQITHPRDDNLLTTMVLGLMKMQDLYFQKGIPRPCDDSTSTTTVLDPKRDKISISQEELLIHEMKNHRLPRYSTQAKTRSPFTK